MTRFFKENLALVTGLSLPLFLIGFFALAGYLGRTSGPDPEHDLVFAIDYYPNMDNRLWNITLEAGKIVVRRRKQADENAYNNTPRLYLFDHATLTVQKLNIDFDKVDEEGIVSSPALEDINRRPLLPGPVAPDGYRLEYRSNGGSGFLGDMFGMSNNRSYYSLVKGSRAVALKGPEPIYNAEPVAWISGETGP